jgi:hypothetical protein
MDSFYIRKIIIERKARQSYFMLFDTKNKQEEFPTPISLKKQV